LSYLLEVSGEMIRAFELATNAVEHARASSDDSLLARALRQYAQRAMALDRFDDAELAYSEAAAVPDTSVSHRISLRAVGARLKRCRGDLETASAMCEQLLEDHRSLGDVHGEHSATQNLAEIEHARGRTERAAALVRRILPAVRAGNDTIFQVDLLVNLSEYLAALNDLPGATNAARDALTIRSSLEPEHPHVAVAMENLALVSAAQGDLVRAALLEGYADAAMLTHNSARSYTEATTHARLATILRDRLAPEELARLSMEGAALSAADAIALALGTSTASNSARTSRAITRD
jgi:ATP/maltotriose-dependent transcriptional regulator MalT